MPFLEFNKISKRFPGVLALDQVSFAVDRGSCHAVMGENGAGKSTLGKILAGVYTPDDGEIRLGGKEIHPTNPMAARELGVAIVHQELAFCPNLSVAENLCLGKLPVRAGWVKHRAVRSIARQMLAEIEVNIEVDLTMDNLSTGQEQMVQIAAALGLNPKVIVMDEPTSSLSLHESEHLFQLLGRLKQRGITVLYVSHRMEEIFQLCDTVTVLRDGRHIATEPVAATSANRVIEQMIGREVAAFQPRHVRQETGEEVLRVENLSSSGKFSNISFSLRRGEVLGFGGLVGAGRSELAHAVFGADPAATGRVFIHGREIPVGSVRAALHARLGLLPEDRKRQGLVLAMNCRENASLAALPALTRLGFIQRPKEHEFVSQYFQLLRVKTPSLETPIADLSGGNQQKIALIKWLARHCDILIIDEPTRGVDVGAKAEIHHLLDDLACRGVALWLISSELPELINLSRRVVVLREGRWMGELERERFSQPLLMRLMAGIEQAEPPDSPDFH